MTQRQPTAVNSTVSATGSSDQAQSQPAAIQEQLVEHPVARAREARGRQ
jgi:hypothetical protein